MAEGDLAGSITSQVLWRPSTAEVAAELPDRAKDSAGALLADFTTSTWPTQDQVEEVIDAAVRDVALRVGTTVEDTDLVDSARLLAAQRAAMRVELRFFRQQVNQGQSSYALLKEMYDEGLEALVRAVIEFDAGGQPGAVDDATSPVFSFPCPEGLDQAGQ